MSQLSQQQVAVRLATWFAERHMPHLLPVQSLSAFVGDAKLNNKTPDVVANIAERAVGIELTAYCDNGFTDAWGAVLPRIREAVQARDSTFPNLRGLLIGYTPNLKKLPPKKKDVGRFADQILDAVMTAFPESPSFTGKHRSVSVLGPYHKWNLLKNHVSSVHAIVPAVFLDMPVDAPTGFSSGYSTRIEVLAQTIEKKSARLCDAHKQGIDEHWLLIHAAGYPESSFITPLDSNEIDRLLESPARVRATSSPYARVILWDYIHGGYVDLVSGQHVLYAQQ